MLPAVNLATFVVLAEELEEDFFDELELELEELLPQPAKANAEIATTEAPVITDLIFMISHS
ncbi:predicted protein [Lactiplantibacillus plantarum]|nr:predicted protein [Lactiplantibacillus plantarum]